MTLLNTTDRTVASSRAGRCWTGTRTPWDSPAPSRPGRPCGSPLAPPVVLPNKGGQITLLNPDGLRVDGVAYTGPDASLPGSRSSSPSDAATGTAVDPPSRPRGSRVGGAGWPEALPPRPPRGAVGPECRARRPAVQRGHAGSAPLHPVRFAVRRRSRRPDAPTRGRSGTSPRIQGFKDSRIQGFKDSFENARWRRAPGSRASGGQEADPSWKAPIPIGPVGP